MDGVSNGLDYLSLYTHRLLLLVVFFYCPVCFFVFNDLEKKKVSSSKCFLTYAPFHFHDLIAVVCRHWISRQLRPAPSSSKWWLRLYMATPDIVSYNGFRTFKTFSSIDLKDLADKLLRVRRSLQYPSTE